MLTLEAKGLQCNLNYTITLEAKGLHCNMSCDEMLTLEAKGLHTVI